MTEKIRKSITSCSDAAGAPLRCPAWIRRSRFGRDVRAAVDTRRTQYFRICHGFASTAVPLFHPERLVGHIESAYRAMWARHRAGDPREDFELESE